MQATTFETLRDLVLHHGARRGWRTQRHIAVACGMDESSLSRFLNGEQDIGAHRTHALFRAVGVPVAQYDLAYALLGHAQEQAGAARTARATRERRAQPPLVGGPPRRPAWVAATPGLPSLPNIDVPAAVLVGLFAAEGFTGARIAAFFGEQDTSPSPMAAGSGD